MTGAPASCGIDIPDRSLPSPSTVAVTALDNTPYSDGRYPFTYTPTVAGSYVLDIKLLTRGGLLGTYYKGANLTYPVLASRGNFHDPSQYHTPYWCDGLEVGNWSSSWNFLNAYAPGHIPYCDRSLASSGCGCDSTRLDQTLSFVWGDESPLPYDDIYSGKFPVDYYSVQWRGYLVAPQSGDYTITLSADYGVQLAINGVTVVNAVPMTLGSTSVTVTLTAGQYNAITLTYYHTRDKAYMQATWSGPGLMDGGEVLGSEYLYYAREILGSPLTVESYPGPVSAVTTTATGTGLSSCVSMQTCGFELQARDAEVRTDCD